MKVHRSTIGHVVATWQNSSKDKIPLGIPRSGCCTMFAGLHGAHDSHTRSVKCALKNVWRAQVPDYRRARSAGERCRSCTTTAEQTVARVLERSVARPFLSSEHQAIERRRRSVKPRRACASAKQWPKKSRHPQHSAWYPALSRATQLRTPTADTRADRAAAAAFAAWISASCWSVCRVSVAADDWRARRRTVSYWTGLDWIGAYSVGRWSYSARAGPQWRGRHCTELAHALVARGSAPSADVLQLPAAAVREM